MDWIASHRSPNRRPGEFGANNPQLSANRKANDKGVNEVVPLRACSKCKMLRDWSRFQHRKGLPSGQCRECQVIDNRERRVRQGACIRILRTTNCDSLRYCSKCNDLRHISQFQHSKGGPTGWCQPCRTAREKDRRAANGMKVKVFSIVTDTEKLCMQCKEMKAHLEFAPGRRGSGGIAAYCRECARVKYYDRENQTATTLAWRKNNRAAHLARHRVNQFNRKRLIKAADDGTVTAEFMTSLYECECCAYCEASTPFDDRTADHMIPLSRGGKHSVSNLTMACFTCNSSKRDMTPEEFRDYIREGNRSQRQFIGRPTTSYSEVSVPQVPTP